MSYIEYRPIFNGKSPRILNENSSCQNCGYKGNKVMLDESRNEHFCPACNCYDSLILMDANIFNSFLKYRVSRFDDPISDLIKDINRYKDFPKNATKDEMLSYLDFQCRDSQVKEALKDLIKEFENYTGKLEYQIQVKD